MGSEVIVITFKHCNYDNDHDFPFLRILCTLKKDEVFILLSESHSGRSTSQ